VASKHTSVFGKRTSNGTQGIVISVLTSVCVPGEEEDGRREEGGEVEGRTHPFPSRAEAMSRDANKDTLSIHAGQPARSNLDQSAATAQRSEKSYKSSTSKMCVHILLTQTFREQLKFRFWFSSVWAGFKNQRKLTRETDSKAVS
jgi:hypothetical protein